ncbi:MAG: acyl-CoA dehydrogenase family protein [Dehalococcoidia bacterium]|nr:acyl-CoA dehydrogenase family protein [Dehalococcoidia bacterium]
MDFDFSEQQRLLKSNARSFMEREIAPAAAEYDKRGPLPKDQARSFLKKLAPLGYISGPIPESNGGLGLDFLSYGVLLEELCRAWASLGGVAMLHTGVARLIGSLGNDSQRTRLLPSLLTADRIACIGVTEPEAGSNSASLATTAATYGADLVVNGAKTWISNGSIADIAVILGITDSALGAKGLSLIAIDKEVSPFGTRELPKLGLKAWPTAELSFVDCRVPRANVIGTPGDGYRRTLMAFEVFRCGVATISLGLAQAALDASVTYARERRQFGRPIGQFQLVQRMVYEMVAETEAARFLTYRAWSMLDKGVRCDRETALAKAYCTEAAVGITSKAIQVHGAYGLSEEYPVERYFRDARSLTIPDGSTQIMQLVVARQTLGMSAII